LEDRTRRFTLIALLYVSQAIPLGFFIVAMPAILRSEGVGLEQVGLLSALAFPWLIKFLWAPLVDRYGSRRHGHYRSWILPLQLGTVLTVAALAGVDLRAGLSGLVLGGALFMALSATQDIATDGLAVRSLREAERGPANGIQVGGYYLGQVLGGGAMLFLFHRLGWAGAMYCMAGLLALPLVAAWRYPEPRLAQVPATARARAAASRSVDFRALWRFVTRSGAGTWLLVLLLFRTGEAMALTMVSPMLVDRGMTLERIGLVMGLVASIAALGGAVCGGVAMTRLGRRTALALFGSLQAVGLCGWLLPAAGLIPVAWVWLVAGVAAFTGGMATAALYTHMMDRSDRRSAATDFTLQQSLCAVGPLAGSAVSGVSAAALGYPLHFLLCASIAVCGVVVVLRRLTSRCAAPALPAAGELEVLADAG
jgi:MFS family permease